MELEQIAELILMKGGERNESKSFSVKLDINDYPPMAQKKICLRTTLEPIQQNCMVSIQKRGAQNGREKLHT